jgi:hypothetical protein
MQCRVAKFFLESVQRCADQAIEPFRSGRLNTQRPTAISDVACDMIRVLVFWQDMLDQPAAKRLSVLDGGLPEAEDLPDLSTVILDSASFPAIPSPNRR